MTDTISRLIQASIDTKQALLQDPVLLGKIQQATEWISEAFQNGHRVWFCGNGGSAADAQHLAAEFSGRFYKDRKALPSDALHCNSSYLTAVANDYSYDEVYARLVRGLAGQGDILVGLSTSGNSANILKALQAAREVGCRSIALTGASGGTMKDEAELLLNVPSRDTPRIQEAHMLIGHIICQLVEQILFP